MKCHGTNCSENVCTLQWTWGWECHLFMVSYVRYIDMTLLSDSLSFHAISIYVHFTMTQYKR